MQQIVSRGHTRPLTEISFIKDGTYSDGSPKTLLVSSAHDKLPQIRNGETGDWIGTFHGHKGAVWSCKVDKLTRTLAATASGDFSAKLWCLTTGKELYEFNHKHVVKCVDFSADTLKIATACQDGLMRLYTTCSPASPPIEFRISSNQDDGMTKITWSSDPNIIIVGKKNGVVQLWDISSLTTEPIATVTLSPSAVIMDLEANFELGVLLVACGSKVYLLNITNLEIKREYQMPNPMTFKEEGGASLSPDGTKFIAGGSDLWLREFNVESGEVLQTLKGHHGPIRCVRYHPCGEIGGTGSEDGTIRLWGLTNPP